MSLLEIGFLRFFENTKYKIEEHLFMDYQAKIAGDLTLKQIAHVCESEQLGGFKLDSLTFGTEYDGGRVRLINKADFKIANSATILTDLNFSELADQDPSKVREEMKGRGWMFICQSYIYVENVLQQVLVFGKN